MVHAVGARARLFLLPLLLVCLPSQAQEGEGVAIEEVVVTGSYLKRETADSPSPLSVISRSDIEDLGAVQVSDIVNSLTFNAGNVGQTNAFSGGDSSTGNTSINLRNLGNGSTLVLINGRRTVSTNFDNTGNGYVDLSGIIPNVAIERMEIVKDGASALYGSDAIAGVVNFITRDNFDGFELTFDFATDDETKQQDDKLISGIIGITGDRGSAVLSASFLDRDPLQIGDRYDRFGQSGLSTFGQPGRYVALGPITPDVGSFFVPGGSTTFGQGADPDCDLAAADDGPKGVQGNVGGLCIYDFSSFFNLVGEEEQTKVHGSANFAVTDSWEIYGEVSFSDNFFVRGNSLFPDVTFAVVPGNHPGLLLDAERRGVNPVPYLALQRMLGGHDDTPFADRPVDTDTRIDREFLRLNMGSRTDFTFGDRSWNLDINVGRSERLIASSTGSDTITSNTNAAYQGLGGPNCNSLSGTPGSGNDGTGACFFYNPFATSVYDPVTGARWDASDTTPWAADPTITVAQAALRYQNPAELINWMAGEIDNQTENKQTVVDVVFAGDLFDMGSGTAGLAIGAQWRKDEIRSDSDKNTNDNNFKFVFGAQDYATELTTSALFAELFLPFTDWAELSLAVRYEDFDEINESTVDPKATLLLTPTEGLAIRASVGTSFRVGSLLQLGGFSTTLLNSTDAFSNTGGLAFRPSITSGNADLAPEEATTFNVGLSWAPIDGPLEGFGIDLDYYNYSYEDIITREGHQDLINQDNALRCPNGLNLDPTDAIPDCGVADFDGDGFTEVVSIGAGLPDKVIRAANGSLLRTQASYVNAQELDTSGIDLVLKYDLDGGDLGLFRTQFAISYTLEYDLVTPAGVTVDGVGSRNAGNSVGFPLPEFKANWNFGWTKNRHAAIVTVRHVDSYDDDVPQSMLRGAFIGFHPEIDSHTTVDVQYNLTLPAFGFQGEGSVLTLGAKNVTNEDPPFVNVDGAYDPFTHDPRGRIWYVRYTLGL